jgi:carbon-monoxide dehydrogenase small subunit
MSVSELLATQPEPSEDEIRDALGGNVCRCTGYQQIIEAVRLAAERMRGA